jgi:hypothetical protein
MTDVANIGSLPVHPRAAHPTMRRAKRSYDWEILIGFALIGLALVAGATLLPGSLDVGAGESLSMFVP